VIRSVDGTRVRKLAKLNFIMICNTVADLTNFSIEDDSVSICVNHAILIVYAHNFSVAVFIDSMSLLEFLGSPSQMPTGCPHPQAPAADHH
jgi:hypothetical protein